MAAEFGRYQIERELGRGASGIVYLAHDTQLRRQVALKVLVLPHTIQGVAQAQATERFLREARAAAAISHPFIPRIYEVGSLNGRCFIAMEYCPGSTLRDLLKVGGPLPPQEATRVAGQILAALQAAHAAGVYHRDIKPENVILTPGDGSVRLMDFGIARAAGDATLTETGALLGTPAYMSPEQILGGPVDGRADLFALAVMLHELLTGRRPFEGASVPELTHLIAYAEPQIEPSLPPGLRQVIQTSLAKDPAYRYLSAADMAAALAQPELLTLSVPARQAAAPSAPVAAPLTATFPAATIVAPAAGMPRRGGGIWAGLAIGGLLVLLLGGSAVGVVYSVLRRAETAAAAPPAPGRTGSAAMAPIIRPPSTGANPAPRPVTRWVPPAARQRQLCVACGGTGHKGACYQCRGTGKCQQCGGKGFKPGGCFFCKGRGKQKCLQCEGTGVLMGTGGICGACQGRGFTVCSWCKGTGREKCPTCQGFGKCWFCRGHPRGEPCTACGGRGWV